MIFVGGKLCPLRLRSRRNSLLVFVFACVVALSNMYILILLLLFCTSSRGSFGKQLILMMLLSPLLLLPTLLPVVVIVVFVVVLSVYSTVRLFISSTCKLPFEVPTINCEFPSERKLNDVTILSFKWKYATSSSVLILIRYTLLVLVPMAMMSMAGD